jgi:hypothetical protein
MVKENYKEKFKEFKVTAMAPKKKKSTGKNKKQAAKTPAQLEAQRRIIQNLGHVPPNLDNLVDAALAEEATMEASLQDKGGKPKKKKKPVAGCGRKRRKLFDSEYYPSYHKTDKPIDAKEPNAKEPNAEEPIAEEPITKEPIDDSDEEVYSDFKIASKPSATTSKPSTTPAGATKDSKY